MHYEVYFLGLLAAFLCFALLLFLAVCGPRDPVVRGFALYVAALLAWTGAGLMAVLNLHPGAFFWAQVMILGYAAVPFAFYQFALALVGLERRFYRLSLAVYVLITAMVLGGVVVAGVRTDEARLVLEYGVLAPYLRIILGLVIILAAATILIRLLRNRSTQMSQLLQYPLAGALFIFLGFAGSLFPGLAGLPLDLGFNTLSAVLIAYTIYRYHLLTPGVMWRYGLLFLVLTVIFTGTCLLASAMMGLSLSYQSLVVWLMVGVLVAVLYQPLRDGIQKQIDRLAHTEQEEQRRAVVQLIEQIPTILDFRQILESILNAVSEGYRCRYACLFLKDQGGGTYRLYDRLGTAEPLLSGTVALGPENRIVCRLRDQAEVMGWETVRSDPVLQKLPEEETRIFRDLGARLLVPLHLRGDLLGFLALSSRRPPRPYSREDRELLGALANQAAVAIDNARLYALARTEAITDGLTGLYNRRFFQESIGRELTRYQRYGDGFAVLLLDVDHFKQFNDTQGHQAGDRLLARLGQLLRLQLRSGDVAARYGGEEFVLLLPGIRMEQALSIGERLRIMLSAKLVPDGGESGPITVSIGVAGCPAHGETPEEILRRADQALYQAKRTGRNRVCLYKVSPAEERQVISLKK